MWHSILAQNIHGTTPAVPINHQAEEVEGLEPKTIQDPLNPTGGCRTSSILTDLLGWTFWGHFGPNYFFDWARLRNYLFDLVLLENIKKLSVVWSFCIDFYHWKLPWGELTRELAKKQEAKPATPSVVWMASASFKPLPWVFAPLSSPRAHSWFMPNHIQVAKLQVASGRVFLQKFQVFHYFDLFMLPLKPYMRTMLHKDRDRPVHDFAASWTRGQFPMSQRGESKVGWWMWSDQTLKTPKRMF